ncbi:MAG: hypothetical protein K6A38_05585 [Lachnospiraceae bacterium]|nr:hypothetical protein [Lachnospiraceae bacterium]
MLIKNKKLSIICVVAAAVFLTAAIMAGKGIKRISIGNKLGNLKDTVEANCVSFYNKYSHSNVEGLESVMEQLADTKYELTPLSEVVDLLKEYPADYDDAIARRDIFSISFGFPLFGADVWDRFVAGSKIGHPGNVVMVQFDTNMVPYYYYIEYDGSIYHIVEDRSIDSEDGESGYTEWFAKYLNVECYQAEAGYAEYAYLTDDPSIIYKDIINYYSDEEASEENAPSAFNFYIGVVTEDIRQTFIVTPEKVDGDYELDYTGYTDKHPSFAEDNPMRDYDGDGILDRVYRDKIVTEDEGTKTGVYLLFGNGEVLTLSEDVQDMDFRTVSADFSGDGFNDICFATYTEEGQINEALFFEYNEDRYILADMPKTVGESGVLSR